MIVGKTLKFVRVKQLKIERLQTDVEDVILGAYSGIRKPELLSAEALLAVADYYPVSVCEIRRGDYRVVGNAHVAVLLKEFAPDTKIQVLVWKHREAESHQLSRLLAALFFGFGSQNAFLRLWRSLSEEERSWVSPSITTRVGLEAFAGVSRKLKIENQEPVLVQGLEKHLLPLEESDEPGSEHHGNALSEDANYDLGVDVAERMVKKLSAEIEPVILGAPTAFILEYLLGSSSEPSNIEGALVCPEYLSDALNRVGLLIQETEKTDLQQRPVKKLSDRQILDVLKVQFKNVWQQAAAEGESGLRLQLCATLTASCVEWLNQLHSDSLLKQFSTPNNLWAAISKLSLDIVEQLAPLSPNAENLLHTVQGKRRELNGGDPENMAQRRHLKTLETYLKGYLTAKAQMRLPLNESEVA